MTVQNTARGNEVHGRALVHLVFSRFPSIAAIPDRIKKLPFTPLQLAVHIYVWQGLVVLIYQLFTHHLTANPLQALQQRTGRLALALLVLSLACTPVSNITGWREPLKRSRTLGLYAFMVAFFHVLIFLDLDNGVAWNYFVQTVIQKWYIIFGMLAFLMLIPLAMTSFDVWKARLGRRWKHLHRIVYVISPIVILHYALSVKGDIFHLRGAIAQPLNYALVVVGLLILRLAFIRRFFVSLRGRMTLLFAKLIPQPTTRS
jgi:methionine sulfoxide reductase heme-binding subunit